MSLQVLKVFTDGASRGNPGEAGIGVVIYRDKESETLVEIGEYIGVTTNNVAEYTALIRGLQAAGKLGAQKVEVYADSELMIKQMNGQYKVKNEGLRPLYQQAKALSREFAGCTFTHIPREKNKQADQLANRGIENKGKKAVEQGSLVTDPGLFENIFPEARGTTGQNFRRDDQLSAVWVEESETQVRSWVRVAPGISRENLAVGEKMMLVKVYFKKGASVPRHSHPHEQSSYIVQGKLFYKIGDEELVLEKGESLIIPGGVEHEAVALEDTVDVNTFVPVREDYL